MLDIYSVGALFALSFFVIASVHLLLYWRGQDSDSVSLFIVIGSLLVVGILLLLLVMLVFGTRG